MTRNISQEIDTLKNREEFDSFNKLGSKMETINRTFSNLESLDEDSQKELMKYIPVSLVATLESLTRSLVKRLIDRKSECFDNADKLFADKKKIDFAYFRDLHRKKFSFGEFMSHQVACNNLEDLNRVFSSLIPLNGKGFFDSLKAHVPLKNDIAINNAKIFRTDYQNIMASVTKVFELRHIICHEMSANLKLDRYEIERLIQHTHLFDCQIYNFLSEYLTPNQPETDEEYYQESLKEYEASKTKYLKSLEQIKNNPINDFDVPVNLELLQQANEHWEKFRETYTQALLFDLKDTPEYNTLYLQQSLDMIDDRVMDLEFDFNLNKK